MTFYVKEFISQDTLEELWNALSSKYKKVIDLSMDSEENFYQDYQQTEKIIL